MGPQHLVGVVVDEGDVGAGLEALPGGADDEGRLAALGDGEDHVAPRHAEVGDLLAAEGREILEALDGLDQRVVAARHDALGPALPGVGRWRREAALPPILPEGPPGGRELDAQAAGGAAAGEEDAAPALERFDEVVAQRLGLASSRPAVVGLHHVAVHVEQHRQARRRVLAGGLAQLGRAGVGSLGDERPEAELHGVAQESLGPLSRCLRWCRHERSPLPAGMRQGILGLPLPPAEA